MRATARRKRSGRVPDRAVAPVAAKGRKPGTDTNSIVAGLLRVLAAGPVDGVAEGAVIVGRPP
jgi:hypothetical protein